MSCEDSDSYEMIHELQQFYHQEDQQHFPNCQCFESKFSTRDPYHEEVEGSNDMELASDPQGSVVLTNGRRAQGYF